jgi:hypothetical protein
MPVILGTQESEINRISIQSYWGKIVCETLSQKTQSHKRANRVTQGVGPGFKPQYHTHKKKLITEI